MRRYLPVVILMLIALALIYLPTSSEQTISLSDFKKELNSSRSISIVMDTRNSPSTGVVMQCGISIAGRLGAIGMYPLLRNHTFVYEGNQCVYESANSSIKECESLILNSTVFYITYNPKKNSTVFYKSRAVVEGDSEFLLDCPVSKMI